MSPAPACAVESFGCAASPTPEADPARRTWLRWAGACGGAAGVATAIPFVSTLAPSERARALGAAVEVDVADLAEGELRTVEWRGKPVWIVRRSPAMLEAVRTPDTRLADPQSRRDQQPEAARNATRSLRPEVFVAVGLCTHLGCSPSAVAAGSANPSVPDDWPGGWFCPCHGSLFDGAGRVFRDMPAPTNLEVPPHRWIGATRLLIGEGDSA